jgi:hypothetical protein
MNTRINLNLQSDLSLTNATFSEPTISSPTGLVQGDISGLTSSLASLVSKDTSIDLRISTENSTRISVDTSLTTRISTEESARTSADTSLTTRVSTEESTRQMSDVLIDDRITNFNSGSYQYVTFAGTTDDINTIFTNTSNDLSAVSFAQVFLNGLLQDSQDYTLSLSSNNSQLTFSDAPEVGSKIKVLAFVSPKMVSLLLDTYTGAIAAYSLRKINTSYTGKAIRVRRTSDNTEQDFGFIGNDLDTASILSFVGSSNGRVTTWYDQSGNERNATNSTANLQPYIVVSGSLVTKNSKPSLWMTSSKLFSNFSSTFNQPLTIFNSVTYPAKTGNKYLFDTDGSPRIALLRESTSKISMFAGSLLSVNESNYSFTTDKAYLITSIFNSTNSKLSINGSQQASGNAGTAGIDSLNIGIRNNNQETGDVYYQEFIIFNSDQTSNKSNIESDINTYWTIY